MKLTTQQENGIKHLKEWKVGALFMEAGTGKTRVACELARTIPNLDFILWIAPLRTLKSKQEGASVIDEVDKWGGFPCDVMYIGVESISSSERIYSEVVEILGKARKPMIIVDESLKIKNYEAKRTKRVISLGRLAEYKLILNGTPLSRNLLDLWAQMEFLSHDILNMTLQQFKDTFCDYTKITKTKPNSYVKYTREYITGYENIDYLYSLIRHYVYECDLFLNVSQNYVNVPYIISGDNMKEYKRLKSLYLDNEMLFFKNNNIFLEMTQKMQHVYCCDEAKFKAVDGIFKKVPQEKTIIFCKYIDSCKECAKRYPEAMVLSYQKEALGLNLQYYNNTIYFDKIWDLALRVQSGRRTYRTGQEYDCHYYDLTGNVGLENMIDRNIRKKVSMTEYFKNISMKRIKEEL